MMVKLTIFSEEDCKELAFIPKSNLSSESIINVRKELCAGHLMDMNFTLVNYTIKATGENTSLEG